MLRGPLCILRLDMQVDINQIIKERILLLDGAMGTMIQRHQLEEEDFRGDRFPNPTKPLKGNNDLLVLTRPEIIEDIHRAYFEAGADIVETNTFSGTSIAQADYDLEDAVYEINYEGARIAKKVALEMTEKEPHKPRFVAGSVGPTNMSASISPDVNDPGKRTVSYDQLVEAYSEQIDALLEGGADLILIETVFDTLNAKAALMACQNVKETRGKEFPIMVSGTITDASGRTLSGQTAEAFLISIEHMPLLSVGLNCALGATDLIPYLQVLSDKSSFNISAHPNAGLPNEFGGYDETPEIMTENIRPFLERGVINILGGCCGTTPDHIKAIAELAKSYSPRKIK